MRVQDSIGPRKVTLETIYAEQRCATWTRAALALALTLALALALFFGV